MTKNTTIHRIQESEEVSPFLAGDHKAARHREDNMAKTKINKKDPQKKYHLGMVSKKITSFTVPTSTLILMWINTHRCLVHMKDPKLIHESSPSKYKSRSRYIRRQNKDKDSTVHTTQYRKKKSNSQTLVGPTTDTASGPSPLTYI